MYIYHGPLTKKSKSNASFIACVVLIHMLLQRDRSIHFAHILPQISDGIHCSIGLCRQRRSIVAAESQSDVSKISVRVRLFVRHPSNAIIKKRMLRCHDNPMRPMKVAITP